MDCKVPTALIVLYFVQTGKTHSAPDDPVTAAMLTSIFLSREGWAGMLRSRRAKR